MGVSIIMEMNNQDQQNKRNTRHSINMISTELWRGMLKLFHVKQLNNRASQGCFYLFAMDCWKKAANQGIFHMKQCFLLTIIINRPPSSNNLLLRGVFSLFSGNK